MSNSINPPKSDEQIERHQHYALVTAAVNNAQTDINGLGKKVQGIHVVLETIKDTVQAASTRNRTLISAAVVFWTLLGGTITVYVKSSIDNIGLMQARISELEKKTTLLDSTSAKLNDALTKIDNAKNVIGDQSRQIDQLATDLRDLKAAQSKQK